MRLAVCCVVWCVCGPVATARAQPAPPPAAVVVSEAEAVARLMRDDARVGAARARIEEVRAAQAERVLWPNPSVTYARESVAASDDTFLLARQELPVSGRRQRLQAAGRLAVEGAEAAARLHIVDLQTEVRHAHAALLLAQERETELRRGIDSLQQLIQVLRAREEAGEGSQYDRMRGDRALLDLRAELASAAAERAEAQGRLAGFFGSAAVPDTLVASGALDGRAEATPLASLIERGLAGRAEYRAAELAIAQFEAERTAAARLRVPTPTVTGGMKRSTTAASGGTGYQFSLDLSVPLFNHGQAAGALAGAQRARAEAEAAAWRARIAVEVRTARTVLAIQEERLSRFRNDIATLVEPLVAIGRVGYEEGELGILELLDSNRQLLEARLRLLDLSAAARRAAVDLDRAMGLEWKP